MSDVKRAKKLTANPYLNLYEMDVRGRQDEPFSYYVASRRRDESSLKAITKDNRADGVILYGIYGEKQDKVVLIRQYRYPVGDYVYELPAGLVKPEEDVKTAGIREMFEETGLTFTPVEGGSFSRPFFTSAGLTDESCSILFGTCTGEPTNANQELSEDIQVVVADREECRRILREEKVALMCAYMLMHFLSGDPFAFLKNCPEEE